jgi:hypothetical protein
VYDIKKSRGSVRAYVLTYAASAFSRNITTHPKIFVSIKVIGRSPDQGDSRVYTVGPRALTMCDTRDIHLIFICQTGGPYTTLPSLEN